MTEATAAPEVSSVSKSVALVDPDQFKLTYNIADDGVWLVCTRCARGEFDPVWKKNLGHGSTLSAALGGAREHICPGTAGG